jgi:aquaporin Z
MQAGFPAEVVLTAMFLMIIVGATDGRAPAGFAPLAIGFGLTLIHLIGIPVTNTSVNPARSTATAVFVGGWALQQLWMFWIAPIVGAAVGGLIYRTLEKPSTVERLPPVTGERKTRTACVNAGAVTGSGERGADQ